MGDGKDEDALDKLWQKVRKKGIEIKHVATDMSVAFIASIMKNASDAVHVFDHFHVVKLMNESLDDIRRKLYAQEKDLKNVKSSKEVDTCSYVTLKTSMTLNTRTGWRMHRQ